MTEKLFKIIDNDISDGYHTFGELYDHRCLLFLAWMVSDGTLGDCYWIREHYRGWDLVCCTICGGQQISYHIPVCYRDIYSKRIREKSINEHKWDGHTSEDVADRIREWLRK